MLLYVISGAFFITKAVSGYTATMARWLTNNGSCKEEGGKHKTSRQRAQDTYGTDVYSVTSTPSCLIMISVLRAHLRIKLHSYRYNKNFAYVIESCALTKISYQKHTTPGPKPALTSFPPHTLVCKPCCYYYWLYEINMYGVGLSLP
jgi:hypothetical protein